MISQFAHGQLNDCYKEIDRIIWVVEDIEYVKQGWQKLGFGSFADHGNQKMIGDQFKNKQVSYTIKYTSASLGGLKAIWIQPIDGKSIYSDHLKKHGQGAIAILHRVNSMKEMNSEIEKMRKQGVDVLQKGGLDGEKEEIKYVF
ncbi:MAG: hypothetical protein ACXAD7_28285, partial [Candidatus Kariarchaeaceae archaeon]